MKIYTLGTSHGHAEVGRECSGTLLEVNGFYYLFDCGGNIEGKMVNLGLPLERLKAVFVSHMHEDHAGSLTFVIKMFTVYMSLNRPITLALPEQQGIDALKKWAAALHLCSESNALCYSLIKNGEIYSDENIKVNAIPTNHLENGRFPSYAFDISAGDKRVLYTGDLSADFHDYPKIAAEQHFGAVVCEATHYSVAENFSAIAKTNTDKLIFTHLYPGKKEEIEQNTTLKNTEVYVAEDGMDFPI